MEYTYDAAGTKLTMKTLQGSTVETLTTYVGGFVYEGATPALSFFSSPEGRVVKSGSSFEYQYSISDHQGNTRIIFTSATPSPTSYTANMESGTNNDFLNASTNRVNFELYDHTDFSGSTYSYSQKLTGATGQQVGVAKSFKVYPGDKVKIEAYAKYMESSGSSDLAGFASALLNAFSLSAPGGGETGTPSAGVNTWGALVAGGSGNGSGSYPKAFVNLLVFDKNYNFLDIGWDQINGGEQIGAEPKAAHDYMVQEYTAKEEGYIYVYVSNENSTLVEVYFDDVVVTHTKSNLIQGNEYYSFGLQTANSWTREAVTGNNYLANGGTELNQTSKLYDLEFRNYDPAVGRMFQLDPVAAKYASLTPYNYSFNNPASFSDPSGADPDPEFDRIHNSQVYYHNGGGAYGYPGLTYDDWDPTQRTTAEEFKCGYCWRKDNMMGWFNGAGSMDRYWHPGDGRMFWSGYESGAREYRYDQDRVRFGEMSLYDFYSKYPGTSITTEQLRGMAEIHNNGTNPITGEVYSFSEATVVGAFTASGLLDGGLKGIFAVPFGADPGPNAKNALLAWAGPGPGIPGVLGQIKLPITREIPKEMNQGSKFYERGKEELEKVRADKEYHWNQDSYPWYKEALWSLYEVVPYMLDHIKAPLEGFGNAPYYPWGYYKDTHRVYFYGKEKEGK